MSILVLSDLWPPFPGGAERLMFNLTRDLMRRGEEVEVLTGYENPLRLDGPPVYRADLPLNDTGWQIIEDFITSFKPDVILTHHLYAFTFEHQLAQTGIPVVQVVLNGRRLECAALAVFISEWVRKQQPTLEPQDLVITPPAFAEDVVPEDCAYANRLGFIKPIKHKGVHLIYELAELLPERQFLILRGEWQDLELIRALPNVSFMQPVVDIRDFYREVDTLLVPSLSEDAGTVAQEATLNGLPCLSSNVQGLRETNAGGIQLSPHDAHAWVKAIRTLDDPECRRRAVASQVAALKLKDQAGKLDRLADRIRLLQEGTT